MVVGFNYSKRLSKGESHGTRKGWYQTLIYHIQAYNRIIDRNVDQPQGLFRSDDKARGQSPYSGLCFPCNYL